MKSFDAFGRPVQEFQVKTTCGGYLSVSAICLVVALFLSELRYFLELETKDQMVIDHNQDQKYLNITVDLTFLKAPCSILQMNLLDPKRANVMHVMHEIYKTRLSSTGKPLGRKVRESLNNVAQTASEVAAAGSNSAGVQARYATTHWRCPSCFQSHIDEDDCCSSCEDVRREFRNKGWEDRPKDYVFGQCQDEAYASELAQADEGCRLEATLHVRKVPATIHIGIGRHFKPELLYSRVSDRKDFLFSMDFSHQVSRLGFGPNFPGLVHVLDGQKKSNHSSPMSEHFQYDVHVIPTTYSEDGQAEVSSHQYSVTEYVKPINMRQRHQDTTTAGLWMNYDFTPFEVKVTKSRKSIWHFLTECCAILGGIFAFTGMLDNFAYQLNKSVSATNRVSQLD